MRAKLEIVVWRVQGPLISQIRIKNLWIEEVRV